MSSDLPEASGQAFEMGRLVQGFASMQASVSRIENKLDSVATKADMEGVRTIASEAMSKANEANTRLDGFSPWRQIGIAILLMLVASAFAVMGLKA